MSGWVYFIECHATNRVKIGWAQHPPTRLAALRTASPAELYLVTARPGTMADERALHERFRAHRARYEWFRLARPVQQFVNDTLAEHGPEPWARSVKPTAAATASDGFDDPVFRQQLADWRASGFA